MNEKEISLLKFIKDRLINYHKEPEECDFITDFKKLITKYDNELKEAIERSENEDEEYDDSLFFDTL